MFYIGNIFYNDNREYEGERSWKIYAYGQQNH